MKFRSDVSGHVKAIRFYKSSLNTGVHTATLFTVTGAKLAETTFESETEAGWQEAVFASPVAITASTTYVAAYHTETGHYAADAGALSVAGIDNAPLHALKSNVDGANGVIAFGSAGTFPDTGSDAANYWVDVVITQNAPVISSLSVTRGPVGRSVVINGSNLLGTQAVLFNGTPAAYAVVSDVRINTSVPDGAATGPISVSNYGGTAQSASFLVRPKITSINPTAAQVADTVTITGTSLLGTTRVQFATGKLASFTVIDDHTVTAIVPGGAETGAIKLATPGGTTTSSTFTVLATPEPETGFRCTRVLGASQTQQWFNDGKFEQYVPNVRWEAQLAGGSSIEMWADPNSTAWTTKITSACGVGPPDRMMLNVYSKSENANYDVLIPAAINNIFTKYPSVEVVILEPIVGGPGHAKCYDEFGKEVKAAFGHPIIDQAIARHVGANIISGLSPEVEKCNLAPVNPAPPGPLNHYMDTSGHLSAEGRPIVAAEMGHYWNTFDTGGTPTPNPYPSP